MQGHLIKYKVGDEWVEIPVALISVYNAYEAYCAEHNIEPVTESTYYKTLGELEAAVDKLTEIVQVDSLQEAVDALSNLLENNVLPTTKGGTGQSFETLAALIEYIRTSVSHPSLEDAKRLTSVQDVLDMVGRSVQNVADLKLNSSDITYGSDEPTDSTEGLYYFQLKQDAQNDEGAEGGNESDEGESGE